MRKAIIELTFAILEVALLAACLILGLGVLLLALLATALAHIVWRHRQRRAKEDWLVSYCRALNLKYSNGGALIHSIDGVSAELGSNAFSQIPRRFRLGDSEPSRSTTLEGFSKSMHEMFGFSIRTGRSIKSSLEELHKRMVYETKSRNLTDAKVGTMSSITYLGLVFFLPMFGAVSSTIFSTLSSSSPASVNPSQNIIYAVLVYVALGLYITAYAYGKRKRFSETAAEILPLFSIAAFVLLFTSMYVSALL